MKLKHAAATPALEAALTPASSIPATTTATTTIIRPTLATPRRATLATLPMILRRRMIPVAVPSTKDRST